MAKDYVDACFAPDPSAVPSASAIHENAWYNQDFGGYRVTEQPLFTRRPIRLVVVGAGAGGLQIAHKAEHFLKDVEVQLYDKNDDIGGTWLENRYPGCTCDIPSHSYQYSWARNPKWSAFYSSASEIWQYFKDVAVEFDLEKYVKLRHTVEAAVWDEEAGQWVLSITAPDGSKLEDRCEILANCSGVLNEWKYPSVPGIESYKGKLMHSARWDQDYDFKDKTVAVIGGGSSAVQIVPQLQKVVKRLIPFLRSPVWITTGFGAKFAGPQGTNFQYSEEQIKEFTEDREKFNQYCRDLEGELNKRFTLNHLDSQDQKTSRELVANMMEEQLGHDPVLTGHMVPDFALGCRRMTPGSGYLQSLTAENVTVVPKDAIRFTETGIVDALGCEHAVDAVVCASGFTTNFSPHFQVLGRKGASLAAQYGDFPQAYLAVMTPQHPNLFHFLGPNAPASHGSFLPILEWQTRYMFAMVRKLQAENIKCFSPKLECVRELHDHTHTLMKRLTWSARCSSWFKNGKAEGPVTAVWPGSRLHWFETMRDVRWEDFDIEYRHRENRYAYLGNGYTQTEVDPEGNVVWYFDDEFSGV